MLCSLPEVGVTCGIMHLSQSIIVRGQHLQSLNCEWYIN